MSPEAIEREFNPRLAVKDFEGFARRAALRSQEARTRLTGCYDQRYDNGPLGTLDVFPARHPRAPVHVFFHGGYWRGRDKSDYSYVAEALVPSGVATVVMNYDLCPAVTLTEIVVQVGRGLRWTQENAASFGGDPARITASGHSAGAHLIAMNLASDLPEEQRLPKGLLRGAVLISGIYDLTPVPMISVNEQVRLTSSEVAPVSPMVHLPDPDVPLTVVVGGAETNGWIEQSRRYSEASREGGSKVEFIEVDDHDHFSIMTLIEEPNGDLAQIVRRMIERAA